MSATEIPVLANVAELEAEFAQLHLAAMDHDAALALGEDLIQRSRDKGWSMAVSVKIGDHEVFHVALPGATPINDNWLRRKRNLVEHTGEPSFLVGQRLAAQGKTLDDLELSEVDFAPHGGGYPLIVDGVMVGSVIVSGVPQQDDHALVVEALTALAV
ncbi:MAG: hypothetical protein F2808_02685 [Actinobacteria bacterium]|uniref:Unannotated protein n=1 Tax=freshwater metagenome TaxID=449393 RepID=A0A6J7FJS1_9ZZZZ|nr:hypothetical protein [Actinomycetota bacterium]